MAIRLPDSYCFSRYVIYLRGRIPGSRAKIKGSGQEGNEGPGPAKRQAGSVRIDARRPDPGDRTGLVGRPRAGSVYVLLLPLFADDRRETAGGSVRADGEAVRGAPIGGGRGCHDAGAGGGRAAAQRLQRIAR